MELLDTILKWAGKGGKSENPGQRLFPADKRPTKDNLAETPAARKAEAQKQLRPVLDAILGIASLPMGARETAIQMASSPSESEAMIRKGGRTDLNMVHNIGDSLEGFLRLVTGRGSISNPSVAIAKDNLFPFARTPTLVMNPASHAFDPDISTLNQLFNRDAYVTRARVPSHRSSPLLWEIDVNTGKPVLSKSNLHPSTLGLRKGLDARFTEGGGPTNASQTAAIMASPKFESFADYERRSGGANTLTSRSVVEESEMVASKYHDWLMSETPFNYDEVVKGQPVNGSVRNPQNFAWLKQEAEKGDSEAKTLLKRLTELPSNYAELKVVGEVGITPKNVSALIVPESMPDSKHLRNQLEEFSSKTGIRAGTASQLMPENLAGLHRDLAEQTAKYLVDKGKQGKLTNARALFDFDMPLAMRPYVDAPSNLWSVLDNAQQGNTSKTFEGLMQAMISSNRYASDAASALTAKDLDAVTTPNIIKALLEKGSQ